MNSYFSPEDYQALHGWPKKFTILYWLRGRPETVKMCDVLESYDGPDTIYQADRFFTKWDTAWDWCPLSEFDLKPWRPKHE